MTAAAVGPLPLVSGRQLQYLQQAGLQAQSNLELSDHLNTISNTASQHKPQRLVQTFQLFVNHSSDNEDQFVAAHSCHEVRKRRGKLYTTNAQEIFVVSS
jgi:hypothetical protein